MKTIGAKRGPRPRELTRHEIDLWIYATRDVEKRREKVAPKESDSVDPKGQDVMATAVSSVLTVRSDLPAKAKSAPEPLRRQPPLAPIEPKIKRRLARGHMSVDAALDLHGMRQDQAHRAVHDFLERSFASGVRIALIVTGKGSIDERNDADPFRRTGVLRQMVPHWLREGSLRKIVMGFEEAAPSQGGYGALYVRIRRPDRHRASRGDP